MTTLTIALLAMKFANIVLDSLNGYESVEDFAVSIFEFPDDSISLFKAITFQSKRQLIIMTIDKIFLKYKNLHNGENERRIQQRFDNLCK